MGEFTQPTVTKASRTFNQTITCASCQSQPICEIEYEASRHPDGCARRQAVRADVFDGRAILQSDASALDAWEVYSHAALSRGHSGVDSCPLNLVQLTRGGHDRGLPAPNASTSVDPNL
jgi:hypothetical protein